MRLLVAMTVSFPGIPVEMTKPDIASAFRLLRIHHALSLVIRTELYGAHFEAESDIVLFFLVMPYGFEWSPGELRYFWRRLGYSLAAGNGATGMVLPAPFLSELYVGDGLFLDIKNRRRQTFNTTAWGSTARGLLGRNATSADKLDKEGIWGSTHTMMGFAIDTKSLTIRPPGRKSQARAPSLIKSDALNIVDLLKLTRLIRSGVTSNISAPRTLCGVC